MDPVDLRYLGPGYKWDHRRFLACRLETRSQKSSTNKRKACEVNCKGKSHSFKPGFQHVMVATRLRAQVDPPAGLFSPKTDSDQTAATISSFHWDTPTRSGPLEVKLPTFGDIHIIRTTSRPDPQGPMNHQPAIHILHEPHAVDLKP